MTVTTLGYTGAVQTYTVPSGVTYVTLQAWGAQGGVGDNGGAVGGKGGYSTGKLIVSPGTILYVYVGNGGAGGGTMLGGWNGGGGGRGYYGGGGGGGASDVRTGTALSSRVIVAGGGGGGGAGGGGYGGYGGGSSGGIGGVTPPTAPGTQTTGATLGTGGQGTYATNGGGGGGGGYYGGYGGTGGPIAGCGGGGGSGFLSSLLVSPSATNNNKTGAGSVVITASNTAPLAPTPTGPGDNGYIINTEANPFTWTFNDTDPGDYQTRADFRYKKFGDVAWTTITNAATTVASYTLAASTWTVGFQYEWQVSTYDNASAQSSWSSSRFTNTIASVPAPTITTPTSGDMEFGTPVELDWTLPGAFTQDAYRVQRADLADGSGVIYYDSGIVALTALSAQIPLDAAAGRTDWLRVQFRYNAHWSAWASVDILDEFGPPHTPWLGCAQVSDQPTVVVAITNLGMSLGYTDTILNDLYRDGVRIAANLPANASFTDLLPGAGSVHYTVTAYSASGATAQGDEFLDTFLDTFTDIFGSSDSH